MSVIDEFRARIARRAIQMEVGGFRPPSDPRSSWFGRVAFGTLGERWPTHEGEPMWPLAQINLTDLPFRPPRLEDLAFITVFIGPDKLPTELPAVSRWALRAYASVEDLVEIQAPETTSHVRPFPMRPRVIEADYPCWEDVAFECPRSIADDFYDLFENAPGFKLGGWPSLVQHGLGFDADAEPAEAREFVFQIDCEEKAHWSWAHGGVGYFGRGTHPDHRDQWSMEWQTL